MILFRIIQFANLLLMWSLLILKTWGNDKAKRIGEKYFAISLVAAFAFSVIFGFLISFDYARRNMKQPKKLTRDQKKCLSAHYLNADEWMLVTETEFYYRIINKKTGVIKIIDRFKR